MEILMDVLYPTFLNKKIIILILTLGNVLNSSKYSSVIYKYYKYGVVNIWRAKVWTKLQLRYSEPVVFYCGTNQLSIVPAHH